jgi:hypothetical protein
MVQLVLQQARGQAKLGDRHEVHASLDHGAKLLEQLPQPDHPENHFVFDHTKWIFYAADCYTWLGDDEPAEEHAREIIAYHTRPDGTSNAPMRSANSHIDLGIISARHGDLDQAVHHGLAAFGYDRKTEASLLSRAADLDHILHERYPDERLADDFHERYIDAYERDPVGGSRFLGQAVHRATDEALSEQYPGRFIYRTLGPDFVDTTNGEMIELTTPGQVASHMIRPGYEGVHYAVYELP